MRIIGKECRKIFDLRCVLILCVLTVLLYAGGKGSMMQVMCHPAGGQCTNSPYDIPFVAKLVKQLGSTVKLREWEKLERVQEELEAKKEASFEEEIGKSSVLKAAEIKDYETFKEEEKRLDELEAKGERELKEKEKKISEEIDKIHGYVTFEKDEKLCFEAQAVEGITEKKGFLFGVPKETAKQWAEESGGTALYQRAYYKRLLKKEASLLPEGVFFILQSDMQTMARHLLICFFILLIPYQVRERLRGVVPLFVTTQTGRKIFGIQLLSSVLSCLCVGVLQLFLYAGIFIWKGLGVFFTCPAWSYDSNNYWSDGFSFGVYMAVYSLLVLLAAVAVVVLIYQIGRMSVNYIIGIAISIPVGFLIWNIHSRWFSALFFFWTDVKLPFWELVAVSSSVVLMGILAYFRVRRDRRREILS
ncbi:MAG: hypothetical protein IJ733_01590 [Lachnospiraceae bacterium]|nr:hypothetical protein [Lachnospiraceae bacterium]